MLLPPDIRPPEIYSLSRLFDWSHKTNKKYINVQPKMSSAMMIDEDEAKELESGDDFIHVMVTDPHKIGDGMSSFIGKLSK